MIVYRDKFIVVLMILGLPISAQAGGPPPGLPPGINKAGCANDIVISVIQGNIAFGSFAVSTGGTVTVNPDGTRGVTVGVDAVLASPANAITLSVDNIRAGCEIYPVKVVLPAATTIDEAGGTTMTLQNFVSNPPTGFTLVPGTPVTVTIGADVLPVAGQVAGAYTSPASFAIQFRY